MIACDVQVIIVFFNIFNQCFDCNMTAFKKYLNLFLSVYIYICRMASTLVENSSDVNAKLPFFKIQPASCNSFVSAKMQAIDKNFIPS